MPAAIYPWNDLRVGETRTVRGARNAQAVQVSLYKFRQRLLAEGWPKDALPQFALAYDWDVGTVTISRLPDGPTLRGRPRTPPPVADAPIASPAARERVSQAIDAWVQANVRRLEAGEPRQMCPLDLVTLAQATDPALAREIASLDCTSVDDLVRTRRKRRATDRVSPPKPPEHDSTPDLPHDRHLAFRLHHVPDERRKPQMGT